VNDLSVMISVLRHAPGPAWVMDRDGRIVHANQAALQHLGPIHMGSDVDPDWSLDRHARVFDRAQEGEETRFERRLRVRDEDRSFLVVVPATPVPGVMVAWLVLDNLSEGLVETERLASMGALAAGVAHEIRNPLTYLSGNLGVLKRELKGLRSRIEAEDPEQATWAEEMMATLDDARKGAERVGNIVEELRSFSRSEEGSLHPIDPAAALEAAINMAASQFRHHVQLQKNIRPTPSVLAHETRLAQVFVNLLLNATHAVEDRDDGRIWVSTDLRSGGVVIEIRDNGPGIDPALIDKIFDPFFTTKPVGVGTGLGLPICRRILRTFDGVIDIVQSDASGTTMRVTIPALLDELSFSTDVTPTPVESFIDRPARVLLVDDEPLVCKTLRRGLGRGVSVRTALSVQEALEELAKSPEIDAIVCDVMMPNLGGADLYQSVQERWPALAPRIIFMTGGTLSDRVQRIIGNSGRPVLEKPFDLHILQDLIHELRAP